VIPKQEVDYLFDLNDESYLGLHLFAKEVAHALKKAIPCRRIGTAVIGLEVGHVHIQLIPINHVKDINFDRPKLSFTQEELTAVATQIRQYM